MPQGEALQHPFAKILLEYAKIGYPVDCGPDWSKERIEAAVQKGPSTTAKDPHAAMCCMEEAMQKVKEGHCKIVKWNDIKDNIPAKLKVSPIAAIPHHSRAYRMILNLSYQLKLHNKRMQSVNDSTDKSLAPQHSMFELGNVIPRIIHAMSAAPDNGIPLLFTKVELKVK